MKKIMTMILCLLVLSTAAFAEVRNFEASEFNKVFRLPDSARKVQVRSLRQVPVLVSMEVETLPNCEMDVDHGVECERVFNRKEISGIEVQVKYDGQRSVDPEFPEADTITTHFYPSEFSTEQLQNLKAAQKAVKAEIREVVEQEPIYETTNSVNCRDFEYDYGCVDTDKKVIGWKDVTHKYLEVGVQK